MRHCNNASISVAYRSTATVGREGGASNKKAEVVAMMKRVKGVTVAEVTRHGLAETQ
jgi:hypothetical protein